jgi:hypothetical protein
MSSGSEKRASIPGGTPPGILPAHPRLAPALAAATALRALGAARNVPAHPSAAAAAAPAGGRRLALQALLLLHLRLPPRVASRGRYCRRRCCSDSNSRSCRSRSRSSNGRSRSSIGRAVAAGRGAGPHLAALDGLLLAARKLGLLLGLLSLEGPRALARLFAQHAVSLLLDRRLESLRVLVKVDALAVGERLYSRDPAPEERLSAPARFERLGRVRVDLQRPRRVAQRGCPRARPRRYRGGTRRRKRMRERGGRGAAARMARRTGAQEDQEEVCGGFACRATNRPACAWR